MLHVGFKAVDVPGKELALPGRQSAACLSSQRHLLRQTIPHKTPEVFVIKTEAKRNTTIQLCTTVNTLVLSL